MQIRAMLALSVTILAGTFTASEHHATAASSAPLVTRSNPCNFSIPSSHNLRIIAVSSGPGTVTRVTAGGYSFYLSRLQNFNAVVRESTGLMSPAGVYLAPFTFRLSNGHTYTGVVNIIHRGDIDSLCLRGVAYRDLGNINADRVRPTTVTLTGTITPSYARIDLWVGYLHYYVANRPRTA